MKLISVGNRVAEGEAFADIKRIEHLMVWYDEYTEYIENSGQRSDAQRKNREYKEELKTLGVEDFYILEEDSKKWYIFRKGIKS